MANRNNWWQLCKIFLDLRYRYICSSLCDLSGPIIKYSSLTSNAKWGCFDKWQKKKIGTCDLCRFGKDESSYKWAYKQNSMTSVFPGLNISSISTITEIWKFSNFRISIFPKFWKCTNTEIPEILKVWKYLILKVYMFVGRHTYIYVCMYICM